MRQILIWWYLAASAQAGCIAVSSDRITARDLSEAVPFFASLDPATLIGFTPLPGTQRTLSSRELMLAAQRHGVSAAAGIVIPSVCAERAVHAITREEMLAALVAGLNLPAAELELLEFSNQPVPAGRLEFQRDVLSTRSGESIDTPVVWRGQLRYDAGRSVAVWAKVRISVDRTVLVAAEDIAAGSVIAARQVKEVHRRQFPASEISITSPDEIAGKIARRAIPAGAVFLASALASAKEISKGDRIEVSVIDGSAKLSLEGIAESAGSKGETILVHNPVTGRNFRARVQERGKVVLKSSPGA